MPITYKVGTRGSLLALTQCNQTIERLKELTGDNFELEIIKTQGDQNTSIPLWQMEGQNFFTKELDQALIEKRVDLVIHSYKDLGSERPKELELGAVTKRSYPHDVLLIKNETISNLKNLSEIIVGTSSPRRITNISSHLQNFLPTNGIKITTETLRGNVNSRISKLKEGKYHAIILALAGLERLAETDEIKNLVKDLNFMVLPLSIFPPAASQGALAIEILKGNLELREKVKHIQDPDTWEEVKREREAFNNYGGGCHLAVGINVKKLGSYFLHFHNGETNNKRVSKKFLERKENISFKKGKSFDGSNDPIIKKIPISPSNPTSANFYITSSHCFDNFSKIFNSGSVWAAGAKTMEKLAKKGFWVNGCADSLGDAQLNIFKNSKFLSLMIPKIEWKTLTSKTGSSSIGEILPAYEHSISVPNEEFKKFILDCENFYWTSFFQFKTYRDLFPQIINKNHFCGLGKTHFSFIENKINVTPFLGPEEFYEHTR